MSAENQTVQRLVATGGIVNALDTGDQTSTGATTITGRSVDTEGVTGRRFQRIHCEWPGTTDLASARQLVLTSVLQDSTASGGTFVAFATGTSKTIANSTTATSVVTEFAFRNEYTLDGSANRHVREVITHQIQTTTGGTTTATGSTFTLNGVMTLAQPSRLPASG